MYHCIDCGSPYPQDSIPFRCPYCNGIYSFYELPAYDPRKFSDHPGLWRYKYAFDLPKGAPEIYLGEGDTPLVWDSINNRDVAFKLEFLNPTGSFKDRGTAVVMSFLKSRGADIVMDDSSGNAGSSLAAYAASAGVHAKIYVPAYASGPKIKQISAYGAEVIKVPGPRSGAKDAVLKATLHGNVYASHSLLPQGIPGYATTAYEICEQLRSVPGTIIMPIGQGNLLISIGAAFSSMHKSGRIGKVPELIGVQAKACAPIWKAFLSGEESIKDIEEGETIAEGVRTKDPYRLYQVVQSVKVSNGKVIAVEESAILKGQISLAHHGFYVEPTSAIVWDAIEQVLPEATDPIVVILTGSGLKGS